MLVYIVTRRVDTWCSQIYLKLLEVQSSSSFAKCCLVTTDR